MDKHNEQMEFDERFDQNLIEDHEYDNIRELDNPAPFWLMGLFYLSVLFSIFYGAYYFWIGIGELQTAEYKSEIAAAEINSKKQASSAFDESNISLYHDEANLAAGAELFATKTCVTCHGTKGEGNAIGPNMTDEYWIHGNTPEQLYQVVKNGVPEKGMTPFKGQLSEKQIVQVISFLLIKLQGTTPENAKAPQGEKLGFYSASQSEVKEPNDSTLQ
ncbi:MAG: c-type cytochrome [Bacteroidales bacterium]|nr:c-type cytochrome [Bacteroidales bacterium]